jgi:hypothetical protein
MGMIVSGVSIVFNVYVVSSLKTGKPKNDALIVAHVATILGGASSGRCF